MCGDLLPGATGAAAAIAAPGHEPEPSINAVRIDGLDPDAAAPDIIAAQEIGTPLRH